MVPIGGHGKGGAPQHFFWQAKAVAKRAVGGLAISVIVANAAWPGIQPNGMLRRLGYAKGANPNEDQIITDMALHIEGGYFDATIKSVQAAVKNLGVKLTVVIPAAGSLARATAADKEWLTLALLSRCNCLPLRRKYSQ